MSTTTTLGRQCETTSVSGLWTPSGDDVPRSESVPTAPPGPSDAASVDEAAVAEELRRVRAELLATPVIDIIANHALGLWQLAVLHLTPEGGDEPNLEEAAIAIDAMAAIVEGLGDRLGANAEPLREALAQLRLAFVQLQERSSADPSA